MRRSMVLFGPILLVALFFTACAKPTYIRVENRPGLSELKTDSGRFIKRAAVVSASPAVSQSARQSQSYFLQHLSDAIREESGHLVLLVPGENNQPVFLKKPGLLATGADAFAICQKARESGVQYLVQAQVINVAAEERKTGIWWFRKTRYFIDIDVAVDVWDTNTGAKLYSQVATKETEVGVAAYEGFKAGRSLEIRGVNEIINDLAQNLGGAAAKAIQKSRWIAAVTDVQGSRIVIAVDQSAGVKNGDRFVVFQGGRIVSGPDGEKYIVPGYKKADVRVIGVEAERINAVLEGQGAVKAGDIVLPAE